MRALFFLLLLCYFNNVFSQQPKLILPIGHTNWVFNGSFSPNNKYVLTASKDNSAKIWDAKTGELISNLTAHPFDVFTANFSPNGNLIVTASEDNTAKIWDAETGELKITLNGHRAEVYSALFNEDGNKIITASKDCSSKIWDAKTGTVLINLKDHLGPVKYAMFIKGTNLVATISDDKTAKIYNSRSGALLHTLNGHDSALNTMDYDPEGHLLLTASKDGSARLWNIITGSLVQTYYGHLSEINSAKFSPDRKKIVTTSIDKTAIVWEVKTGKIIGYLKGHDKSVNDAVFDINSDIIYTVSDDHSLRIWNLNGTELKKIVQHKQNINKIIRSNDGSLLLTVSNDNSAYVWETRKIDAPLSLTSKTCNIISAKISSDGNKISSIFNDGSVKIWEVKSGKFIANNNSHNGIVNSVAFTNDGKKIVTTGIDNTIKISDASNGNLLLNIKAFRQPIDGSFNESDSKLVCTFEDSTCIIYDAQTGHIKLKSPILSSNLISAKFNTPGTHLIILSSDSIVYLWDIKKREIKKLIGHAKTVNFADFNKMGDKVVTASSDQTAIIWSLDGKILKILKGHKGNVSSARFNNNGSLIVTSSFDKDIKVWDVNTGIEKLNITGHTSFVWSAQFSGDDKKILSASRDKTAKVWNAETGKLISNLTGHLGRIAASYSREDNNILTYSLDNKIFIWNAINNNPLYSFFFIDSSDYLVVDKYFRYDGTANARKLLYFTCGTEIIDLDQVKDELWVPNLAERIMNGENINSKKLSDIDICGLTPITNSIVINTNTFNFKIKPRRGGLGETVLYVNGIEARRYKPEKLKKVGSNFELIVKKSELNNFFISGRQNEVSVKAYTFDNGITSRGMKIHEDRTKQSGTLPNLYAVMVGVSDYKGEELDLKYAAKDASDISKALAASVRKLLNSDGKEHVFMYNLTTTADRFLLPEKISIKKTLEEIGKKATANDILLIFFAGHGVMEGENKQFYFLTADASKTSAASSVKDVGISTSELTDWMKPQSIKAQKRILIFDACNSGQAIKDFVKMGTGEQNYIVARNDDNAQQIKAIDKLNEKSGVFILSASASNQSAYEMGRYSQGLLTYALLKAIKQQPDILEDGKYLSVSRWFEAAERTVTELARESGARQTPQIVSNTNFNIGLVDDEVMGKINLPQEKPLFTASNFQNSDEKIEIDDLDLSKLINMELNEIAARSVDSKVIYVMGTNSPDAYTLTGRYDVKQNEVTIRVSVRRLKEIKYRFELSGTRDQLQELAAAVVEKAAGMVK